MFNKKAQIGSTLTWFVATIAIIVILSLSLFIAEFAFGNNKNVAISGNKDTLASKSFFSYLLTANTYEQIKILEGLDDSTGNLALQIFNESFEGEYPRAIWVGIVFKNLDSEKNDYFLDRPAKGNSGFVLGSVFEHASEEIKLNSEKSLEILLLKHETNLY